MRRYYGRRRIYKRRTLIIMLWIGVAVWLFALIVALSVAAAQLLGG